ncbi:MAG TPA: B12-binding domain-containing radical SAM protein [Elusimicrobia bacterium]|nr:B12-binding domain-containing radical SAM protein [Elusimicrobiota bacterium]
MAATDIVLTTLNARYAHCSFALRYLMANLGELEGRAKILEFDAGLRTPEIIEAVLSLKPRIVGIGVYVWNALECRSLVTELKRLRPELIIILGGPEVSHETAEQRICRDADYVITGEGELAFAGLVSRLLSGSAPVGKLIAAPVPDLNLLALPYALYSAEDIANRVIYVEASRGCPFACDFCLSSLDGVVRAFPLEKLFGEWDKLLNRGARRFKFVDRTFNLDINTACAILKFFFERLRPGLFLHFEMVPDRFPDELYELVKKFPAGALQFEIGIQTFNEAAAARINRRQDNAAAEKNILRLRRETSAYLHADLIIGLPGEDLAGFAAGFDRLAALGPHEIQVGLLKRLRGAPISRHDEEWGMVYSPYPPYELRENKLLDFFTIQRLRRFARYWDLIVNSGVFRETAKLICGGDSPFHDFLAFSDWLYGRTRQTHAISRSRLRELLLVYLTEVLKQPAGPMAAMSERDASNSTRNSKEPGPQRQSMRHNHN